MEMRIKKIILCIAVLLSANGGIDAQDFMPVITNYSSFDYHAGLQNWSIVQDKNRRVHIGNNMGVLSYDGYYWQVTQLPGNITARSLLADGERLYVGGYQEFGYLTRNSFGLLQYTSLWKQLKGYSPHNDEIWNIIRTANGHILFQSFCSWFEYDGKDVKAHYDPKILPLFFFNVNGRVFCQLINGGFCELEADGQLRTVLERTELVGDEVMAVLSVEKENLLLCTKNHGIFRYDGHNLRKFQTEIENRLSSAQINRAVMTRGDSTIVIGTISDGIYGINLQGKVNWHYNTLSNLQNNTVLNLMCDGDDNVWAALDAGIALIHCGAPYGIFRPVDLQMGLVYDIYKSGDYAYIATNEYTYFFSGHTSQRVDGTHGQNWYINRFGGQLFVGNNLGTKILYGNQAIPLSADDDTGSTALHRFFKDDEQDYLIVSSYNKLRVYRQINGKWQFLNDIEGFTAPISQFEIDHEGVIWATHMNGGLFRVELAHDMRSMASLKYFNAINDDAGSKLHVMKIQEKIVISDGVALYTTTSENDHLQPFTALNELFANERILSATSVTKNEFWLASDKGYTLVNYKDGKYQKTRYIPASFWGLECSDNINTVRVFDNYVYFCLNGGVGRVEHDAMSKHQKNNSQMTLAEASYATSEQTRHQIPIVGEKPNVGDNITLRLSYPNYDCSPVQFRFILEGGNDRRETTSERPEITYNNLKYGDYSFRAEAFDSNGRKLSQMTFSFHYAKPPWLSVPFILVYLALMAALIYGLILWSSNLKIKKAKRHLAEEKVKQDLQIAEQQRLIEKQQKQILEQQLQEKGRELAMLTMDEIKKTDDDYWKIYRENFDLIHKNFFRNLRERYPSLTPTDLRFCALLRLNLSTKDIANFTGLTIRGVEGARHRLRKKIQLPENINLSDFFIEFK